LAAVCEPNILHKHLLVEAEYARVTHDIPTAIKYYQAAIASAKQYDFGQNQALAHELYARFWLAHEETETAQIHLRYAQALYLRWEATAKAKQLDVQYPELHAQRLQRQITATISHSSSSSSTIGQMFDLTSVMKASQAISEEIKLTSLLEKIMRIVIQNAGAQRGLLILHYDNQWLLQAEADESKVVVMQAIPLEAIGELSETPKLSTSVLRYVEHAQKALVLDDARLEKQFAQTAYIQKHQPRSVLCVPLINQGELTGMLYLENSLVTGAFTSDRVDILNLLSSQAAISIDKARLLAERQDAIVKLQAVDRAKSQFITMMSHELRTPLNAINGFAELLMLGLSGELPKQAQDDVQLIHNNGQHLLNLINDIIDISQIESGQVQITPEYLNVQPVIDEVLMVFRPSITNKPVEFVMAVPEDLPLVYADRTRLKQILLNLVSNAVKFTSEGTITIKVESDHSDKLCFMVIDTGIGIPPDKLEIIFERFQQADMSDARRYGGMGLGLSICLELVRQHGGDIFVESELDHGTTFRFTIPCDGENSRPG
jgi:signal transduction histidine kinase